jgi:hypothetical protein
MGSAVSLLKEKHHGVLISAVQLCAELCKASKEALEYLRKVRCILGTVIFFPWTMLPITFCLHSQSYYVTNYLFSSPLSILTHTLSVKPLE